MLGSIRWANWLAISVGCILGCDNHVRSHDLGFLVSGQVAGFAFLCFLIHCAFWLVRAFYTDIYWLPIAVILY